MARFFVEPESLKSDIIILTGENAQHAKVLRLKAGEQVLVCDGEGSECVCTVDNYSGNEVTLAVLERRNSSSEAGVHVSIYMGFPKSDKLEHVIQKATELGADEIIAFPAARSVSRPDEKSVKKKLERWQKIAASAAEQSGRGRIPQVLVLDSYAAALERAASADKALMFYENEDIGICLGKAFSEALGDKRGIVRYGSMTLPMDEALILSAVDISGRSYLAYDLDIPSQKVGTFDTELTEEFWLAFTRCANLTLHIRQLAGKNSHHIIEGTFKSVARSLRQAVSIDPVFADEIPSTKGVL